ncbi:HAD family hydrolase [Mycobacterium intermedium]|uniref:Probable cation-transporting ATPase I n=1 Tax=Mycobacterium intermedium TaxID=28445 RepID=A0A1E3SM68_MYCIE|nr:cation-translocating P-type ATPase [Mycobacterium intermedium]ODR02638.1 HAD family hydrolase [Mycobacterium intermedium]OPE51972.1 HAD family hydrolase [Mycobacterium intermedium]ORB10309.1 HAD family hydrolase [Mycobacterium intermedium]
MKIPGVAGVIGGITSGAALALRAGISGATGAAGTVQTLTSPVVDLVVPVVETAAQSTSRMLGQRDSADGAEDTIGPPIRWQSGRRVHFDLDPLLPFPRWHEHAAVVEEPVRRIPGVAQAHVEGSLGRLVVEIEADADTDDVLDQIRETVAAVSADLSETDSGSAPPAAPFADPGNPLAILVPLTAAAMDVVAISAAVTGWFTRLPVAPRSARAAAALINYQPRVVSVLESRLGRVGTDIALSGSTALAYGLSQSVGTPVLDLVQRGLQLSEAAAHRQRWREREPELASPTRPQAPVVSVLSSSGEEHAPRHNWAAAAAGEASHVVVDGAIDSAIDTAKGSMAGPIEEYVNQAANGSVIAAAGALFAGGGAAEAAEAILAGVPKAAHLGRQAFAATLGRGLANQGLLVLDPGALRRLDRVKVVVIDGAALRGDHRAVLHSRGEAPGWDDDRVYEVADALLHGEEAPEPDPDELPATGARLKWIRSQGPSATPAQGLEHAELICDGERVGSVDVGWEVDPYAVALLQTAHRTGARVVLRNVAGTEDLSASVGSTHPPGTPLLKLVRELRADRGPVLLITALHRDFASTDTLAALAIADVGVALDDPRAATPWTADIITGTDLAAAVRLLSALPAARAASESAVHLAQGGTTLAGLLLVTGEQDRTSNPASLRRWLNPVNAAAATALISGTWSAARVLRLPDPTPQPLTAWHALDPEIVYSRLAGGKRPLAVEAATPTWRRRLSDLSYEPAVAPLRGPIQTLGRLARATRVELSDPLTPILAVGAAASAIVGSNVDAVLVAGVMAVNALTGGVQRLRAEAAAAELFAEQDQLVRRVVVPAMATTRRRLEAARHATRTVTVSAKSLRVGDVIDLAAPEVVPADARVLIAEDLEVDESFLTGESLPVDKQVDPVAVADPDRASMLFEGSTIVAGHARAIVVATGVGTAAHRAISAVADVETSAGVQARLRELTSKVLPMTLAGGAAVTGLALLRRASLRQAVADGVAIAVAAVPEGLPLVATLSQLAAAQRLTARGALVRSPRTIEALGRVDTICFDKTGTLTENRLRVVCAIPRDAAPGDPLPEKPDPEILQAAARASTQPHNGEGHAHATDEAIITAAISLDGQGDSDWTVLAEVPFESSRGYAATIGTARAKRTKPMLMVKGAPEEILPRCRFADPDTEIEHAETLVHELAEQGLRVLAVAQRPWDNGTTEDEDTDADAVDEAAKDLELLGYVGLADTARPSSRPLIEALLDADRNVVLITGDHPVTARAIARQLGLPADVRVVTGAEIAGLDEDARAKLAADVQVFARVSPEQKVQIVAALQRCGRVTAMVGDGANDAAAIRMADVGIGVSGRGSSAARGAADIVLTDDDLGVLIDALVEGRGMWAGVRDAVTILVGGNVGEVMFTVLGTAFGNGRAPIGTRQLLLVNLLTDMFPALAVAVTSQFAEPDEAEYDTDEEAEEARRAHRRAVLTGPTPSLDAPLMRQIVNRGVVTAAGATAAWTIGRWTPGTERRTATMGLTALVTTQLAQTLLTRQHSPLVVATALGSAGALIGIIQTPGLSQFFGCTPLGPVAWLGVGGATAGATVLSVLAPKWLTNTVIALEPGESEELEESE